MLWGFQNPLKKSNREIIKLILTMPETCTLDAVDKGCNSLSEIGEVLGGLSKQRIQQIEGGCDDHNGALKKLRHPAKARMLEEIYSYYNCIDDDSNAPYRVNANF